MPQPEFRYYSHHPVQRTFLAELALREPVWTEAVNAGSSLTAKITVPDSPAKISEIDVATMPEGAAIYVDSGGGRIPWGGVVKNRKWNTNTNELTITVQEWRNWLYRVIMGPKTDGTGGNTYAYTNTDQFVIARAIINNLTGFNTIVGMPYITTGTELSGKLRQLTVLGTSFRTAAEWIDSMADRENGFDWDLEPVYANDGLPQLRFNAYAPERGGVIQSLLFAKTPNGGNIIDIPNDIEESSEERATRVWAIGEGPNADSVPYAVDDDPDLVGDFLLRQDLSRQYNVEVVRSVLASHARAERQFRESLFSTVQFDVRLDTPDYYSYSKGDRGRFVLQDRFYDLDIPTARVLAREVRPDDGIARITLNLNDVDEPEFDEAGVV